MADSASKDEIRPKPGKFDEDLRPETGPGFNEGEWEDDFIELVARLVAEVVLSDAPAEDPS